MIGLWNINNLLMLIKDWCSLVIIDWDLCWVLNIGNCRCLCELRVDFKG